MSYIIKSPVDGYNGESAGVKFTGGVGTTDNLNAAAWLKNKGYEVAEAKKGKPEKTGETPKTPEAPKSGDNKGGKK